MSKLTTVHLIRNLFRWEITSSILGGYNWTVKLGFNGTLYFEYSFQFTLKNNAYITIVCVLRCECSVYLRFRQFYTFEVDNLFFLHLISLLQLSGLNRHKLLDFMFSNPLMLDDLDHLFKSDLARSLLFFYQVARVAIVKNVFFSQRNN